MLLTDDRHIIDPPLFQHIRSIASCPRCMDTGLWFDNHGLLVDCPLARHSVDHAAPNAAARTLRRSIDLLKFHGHQIGHLHFDIARSLTFYTSADPCPRSQILARNFSYTPHSLRKFHDVIEHLQRVWLLPVGSRKQEPFGYWIITEMDDFSEWLRHAKTAPITRISTLCGLARAHFPLLAEQLELEFWSDIKGGESECNG